MYNRTVYSRKLELTLREHGKTDRDSEKPLENFTARLQYFEKTKIRQETQMLFSAQITNQVHFEKNEKRPPS